MRHWSVRHARKLKQVYVMLEFVLVKLAPVISKIGYQRLEGPIFAFEKALKGVLLDSQSCGQCVVGSTGMSCPMNCPKALRNGPCGGVRQNGKCEIEPTMTCVWLMAWEVTNVWLKKFILFSSFNQPLIIDLWEPLPGYVKYASAFRKWKRGYCHDL